MLNLAVRFPLLSLFLPPPQIQAITGLGAYAEWIARVQRETREEAWRYRPGKDDVAAYVRAFGRCAGDVTRLSGSAAKERAAVLQRIEQHASVGQVSSAWLL